MRRRVRSGTGFSLISVTLISTAMLLLAGVLFLQSGASRRDGISERAATDSFYTAETGINTLAGKLSQMGLGANAVSYTDANLLVNGQSVITSSNRTQGSVVAAASGGQIQSGTAYQGATPQGIGNGLSYVIYEVNVSTCQNSTQPCNSLNAAVAWDRTTIPTNVARLDIKAMGFRGRSVASNVSASVFPNVVSALAGNKYAAFGRDFVSLGNGDTFSAMPFCSYSGGVSNCSLVTYVRGIYRNKSTGVVTYITDSSDPSLSSALSSVCPNLSDCETVTGIYKNTSGGAVFATSTNLPPSGAVVWPVVDSAGNALPLPLRPGDTAGTSNLAPALPSGTVLASNGNYALDPTYSYLPEGNVGNIGSNGTTSGTSGVSGQSGTVINGTVAVACSNCTNLSTAPTGGVTTIPALSLPAAPEPPSASMSCALNTSGGVVSSSSAACPASNGSKTIVPVAISGSTATGSDKYPVINLTNTSGGGVSISGSSSNVLTLYSGRYVVTDLDLSGSSSLRIVQTNGDPVVLYVIRSTNVSQVETLSISGNGIANTSTAGGLQIYSNTSNEIKLNGNGALRAVIYAPNGTLTLNGGGNSGYIVGTYLGQKVNFNGQNPKVVYDESLGRIKFPINTARNVSLRNWQRL